jgi:hypothetical protein
MSKSAKAKVDDLLGMESHQLCEQKIHKIHAAMEALVDGADNVSSTKCRQFQVFLNSARQAATTWSDADRQKAIERLEHEIHQVTPAKHKLSIYYSNIISDNYCRKPGPRQLVPKAYSLNNLH